MALKAPGDPQEEASVVVVNVAAAEIPAVARWPLGDERSKLPTDAVVSVELHEVRRVRFEGVLDPDLELRAPVPAPLGGTRARRRCDDGEELEPRAGDSPTATCACGGSRRAWTSCQAARTIRRVSWASEQPSLSTGSGTER